jgi:hypothetical protein|tara:strand:+ start:4624 stop:4899 length:276 start_codon:yes stop_codon:yes gene_type:complete
MSNNLRVEFLGNGQVDVMHVGLDALLPKVKERYVYTHGLPNWVREKIAILSMTNEPHPTSVPKVGTRINQNVFWLEVNGDEELDDDTRKES